MTCLACQFSSLRMHGRLILLIDNVLFMEIETEIVYLNDVQLLLHEEIELLDASLSIPVIEY